MDYGVFCSVKGYPDGLVHISQLDPNGGRVDAPGNLVAVGDRVRVKVLGVEGGKISLSMRSVAQDADAPAALLQRTPLSEAGGSPPTAIDLERLDCVSVSYSRSSGSGGQNVNKLSTKAEARLMVDQSPWPEAVKARLKSAKGGGVLSSSGALIVVSEKHRTQAANKRDALEKLAALVATAWRPPKLRNQRGPGPSFKGKRVRREEKKRLSAKKQSRSASRRGDFD